MAWSLNEPWRLRRVSRVRSAIRRTENAKVFGSGNVQRDGPVKESIKPEGSKDSLDEVSQS